MGVGVWVCVCGLEKVTYEGETRADDAMESLTMREKERAIVVVELVARYFMVAIDCSVIYGIT